MFKVPQYFMIISNFQKTQTLYRTEVFPMQPFSASQLVQLHQSLGSTVQPMLNTTKFCWYGQLTPPSLLGSCSLTFFLLFSQRYPNENAFLGSGVDFTKISAFSLELLHLRSHSLVLPTYGHLEERRKELTV